MKNWTESFRELEKVQAEYSDTHKDYFGFRPQLTWNEWNDIEKLRKDIRWMSENMPYDPWALD